MFLGVFGIADHESDIKFFGLMRHLSQDLSTNEEQILYEINFVRFDSDSFEEKIT